MECFCHSAHHLLAHGGANREFLGRGIFTVSGKLVKTINTQTNTGNGVSSIPRDITWDGTDDYGNKIGKGVYIYKLKVTSTTTGLESEKIEKLVIL